MVFGHDFSVVYRTMPLPALHSPVSIQAALLLALASAPADAAHPLITEDTGTQGARKFQLEVNAELSRDRAAGVLVKGFQPAAAITYGLRENLDVQLGRPYLRQITDPAGANTVVKGGLDTSLDLKWRFFEHGALSFGLKPGITFATGDEGSGLGTGRSTLGSLLIASWDSERLGIHAHAGWRRNSNSVGQRENVTQLAAAAVFKATESSRLIADLSRTTNPDRASNASIRYLTLGLIYSPRKEFDLDVGWRRAAGAPALDRALMFGSTLRW
ncbi:MAG: hypothetical protein H7Y16_03050 [Candidatus Parcubacteria bacterium]|nr:hypothetical protein [Burkholderiales bacterium]